MRATRSAVRSALVLATSLAPVARAEGDPEIHGFVSEGGFASTSNDYLGPSSRGTFQMFEVGLNASGQLADRLRAGIQVFARDFGEFHDAPHIDWAFVEYQWRPWLGFRAGVIKMPFGLYNEYADVDAARTPILMPQGVYPLRNRDVLLSHRGIAAYGDADLGGAGELEYQAWLGTLSIPANALDLTGATYNGADTRYVTGAQVFWHPPVDGLRVGATILRASIDFDLTLSAANRDALIMAGVVPPDYDGSLIVSQRPDTLVVGSVEYARDAWLLAAEYCRAFKHQQTSLPPAVIAPFDEDSERFYVAASRRMTQALETGAYLSVNHLDAGDRHGRDPRWPEPYNAFQRDVALTLRYDVTDNWLWKLEGHFIDGTADLLVADNPAPDRYWGLFLIRTTVTY